MTSQQLQDCLDRLGVVRVSGGLYCRCLNCQPDETDPDRFKMAVSPGSVSPIVTFCLRCGKSKAQTEEDRSWNRWLTKRLFTESGIDLGLVFQRMESAEIRRLWTQVKVGGECVPHRDEEGRADPDTLNRAYTDLLTQLTLSERHRKWLTKRGLDAEWCFRMGYRSTPPVSVRSTSPVVGVPGLTQSWTQSEGQWLLRQNALLIPCRDRWGRVLSLKQRLFDGKKGRMRLVSGGGVKALSLLHFPLGSVTDQTPLWVTEGERKADALFYWYRLPTVGLPGVSTWSWAADVGRQYGQVILALDNDDPGRKAADQLALSLGSNGVSVLVAKWEGTKGIDDALAKGLKVTVGEWTGERESEGLQSSPPTKRLYTEQSLVLGQRLSDHQILQYLRQFGPVLRQDLKGYPPTISSMIRQGQIVMHKDDKGQWLEAT